MIPCLQGVYSLGDHNSLLNFFFLILKSFIYFNLAALGLSYCMRDLAPCPGIEPRPPALGVQSLSHWTTREVPPLKFV